MNKIQPLLKISFLPLVSILGFGLMFQSLARLPSYPNIFDLVLILILAATSQLIGATPNVEKVQAYEVGSAVGIATIPIYGPFGGALAGVASGIGIWLTQCTKYKDWRESIRVLSFNIGMFSLSLFLAGNAFIFLQNQIEISNFSLSVIPWIVAAIINDQLNLLLLFGVFKSQGNFNVSIFTFWRKNLWAALINISVATVGGSLLSSAMQLFGWKGIAIFFMPIILSSFAFRIYVRQMQNHLNNLEEIVDERTKALKMLMQEKDAFLAVLTHDMKSPLTSIGLYVDLIRHRPHLLQEKPHIIDTIGNSQMTLLDIVNNILDLEKLQADGNIPLDCNLFDLIPTIESIILMLNAQAGRKDILIEFEPRASSFEINGDQQQIQRVFQNLISNAIKYTQEDGHVCIKLSTEDNYTIVEIIDNGYGIPENEINNIFERFQRVSSHEKVAVGTGLGLAITKAIVEAHQGEISVESEVDKGSTFTVKLPIQKNIMPALETAVSQAPIVSNQKQPIP